MDELLTVSCDEDELRLGFEAQTLTYPSPAATVPLLADAGASLERTVALVMDVANRLRRRHGGGYVHERFDGREWTIVELLESLAQVADSDVYRRYRQHAGAESTGPTLDE